MLHEWFEEIVSAIDMEETEENPYGFGTYLKGSNSVTGTAWYYQYDKILSVAKCDFMFTKDTPLKVEANAQYLGIRLEYAQHLPPGKIIAFLEEDKLSIDTTIKKGTRFAYTEVAFSKPLYNKEFREAFSSIP